MSMSAPPRRPRLAYLVSQYPAVSHTFILREVLALRALGHDIQTASVNPADRPVDRLDVDERREAEGTYCLKAHGAFGAGLALLWALLHHPGGLLRILRRAPALGPLHRGLGRSSLIGLAYAVEAAMLARWMAQHGRTHLHVHFGSAAATVGLLVRQLCGCHLSLTVHGPDEFDDVGAQQLRAKVAEADAIVCISQFARSQLMRLSPPEHWAKIVVCRLGVDPNAFDPPAAPASPPERTDGHALQLLCVGRLTPAKGQVLLLHALSRLRREGHPVRLTLVGGGPDQARLREQVAVLGLADVVTLTGALNPQQARTHYHRADAFVLPSLAEGIPVVLMEAMASGLPCVSTTVNGIPELIEHLHNGLLIAPGDVDALTDALRRVVTSSALRDRLGRAARETVALGFHHGRNTERLSRIFEGFAPARLLRQPRRAASAVEA